jgi:hypothetical protein
VYVAGPMRGATCPRKRPDMALTCVLPTGFEPEFSTLRWWLDRTGKGLGSNLTCGNSPGTYRMATGHFCVLLGPFLAQPSAGLSSAGTGSHPEVARRPEVRCLVPEA